jgi:3-oxoacyl-[acyl-carrier-protein] synthase II
LIRTADLSRRVAVTGIGLLSSLGANRQETWQRMLDGRCGIRDVTLFDTAGFRSHKAAELSPYPADTGFSRKHWDRLSRADQSAVLATKEALADSGLLESGIDRARVGVLLGSGTADMMRNETFFEEMTRRGLRRARARHIFNHFPSTPGDVVASRFELTGLRANVLAACSSSTIAIGWAGDAIREGRLEAAVCGASDVLCRLTFSGFNALRLVDPEPCRPFETSRKGMNIGEAAAMLVLEEMDRARRRGAAIYAELVGYGATCEAYHPTSPEPDGHAIAAVVRTALNASRVDASDVDHINAHGTATLQNDRAEARGFRRVFGDRTAAIPVTSIKSMVGHCLGAAGAIEAASLALALHQGVIPPTVHHETTDPECPVDVVANSARQMPIRCGISTSLAFGGNDAALVMRRV